MLVFDPCIGCLPPLIDMSAVNGHSGVFPNRKSCLSLAVVKVSFSEWQYLLRTSCVLLLPCLSMTQKYPTTQDPTQSQQMILEVFSPPEPATIIPGDVKKKKKSSKKPSSEKGQDGNGAAPQAATEYMIKPESTKPALNTAKWPLLLRNYDDLECRAAHYTPIPSGCSPLKRELKEYIRYGVINLDKPANPSSHEVLNL